MSGCTGVWSEVRWVQEEGRWRPLVVRGRTPGLDSWHCRSFPRSLIYIYIYAFNRPLADPYAFSRPLICPYVLLLVVSRLFCPCSCLHVTLLSLPVPLLPCAAGLRARRSSNSAGWHWNLLVLEGFIYWLCYFMFFGENKVSPSSTLCIWVLHHQPPLHFWPS